MAQECGESAATRDGRSGRGTGRAQQQIRAVISELGSGQDTSRESLHCQGRRRGCGTQGGLEPLGGGGG